MRKNTSLILAAAFVIVSVTGVLSVIGHIKFDFLDSIWMKIAHILAGIIFIGAGIIHLKLNISSMMLYIRRNC